MISFFLSFWREIFFDKELRSETSQASFEYSIIWFMSIVSCRSSNSSRSRSGSIGSNTAAVDIRTECRLFAICKKSTPSPEVIWLADVPVLERDRPAVSHPEEGPLLGLVRAGGPKVLVTEPKVLDMLLEPVVLLLRGYTRQMHPVITAVLRSSVPVCLRCRGGTIIF